VNNILLLNSLCAYAVHSSPAPQFELTRECPVPRQSRTQPVQFSSRLPPRIRHNCPLRRSRRLPDLLHKAISETCMGLLGHRRRRPHPDILPTSALKPWRSIRLPSHRCAGRRSPFPRPHACRARRPYGRRYPIATSFVTFFMGLG
jgi:hypothetical protein